MMRKISNLEVYLVRANAKQSPNPNTIVVQVSSVSQVQEFLAIIMTSSLLENPILDPSNELTLFQSRF